MADADEDAIFHPTSTDSAPQVEVDLSDEMQDFRFLNSLSLYVFYMAHYYRVPILHDRLANNSTIAPPIPPKQLSPAVVKRTLNQIRQCCSRMF